MSLPGTNWCFSSQRKGCLIDRTIVDLANLAHVTELIPWFSGIWRVKMSNGSELDISRERSRKLKDLVGA